MASLIFEDQIALSPEPILAAAEDFHGKWIDLDRFLEVDAAAFARGRKFLSAELAACGLSSGDRVVMAIGNGPLFPAMLTAILECGGSPLLMHYDTPPAELLRIATRFDARFIARDSGQENDLTEFASSVRVMSKGSWTQVLWAELSDKANGRYPTHLASSEANGSSAMLSGVPLHPTSGTTGEPQIAARPAAAALAEARHWIEAVGIDKHDTILAIPPMSHAYAYGACVMTPLLTSARLVSMRRFRPKKIFHALEEYAVTVMPTVPVTLDVLMFGAGNRLQCPGLRVITAGSPLPEATAAQFKKTSGITIRSLYGATETGIIAITPPDLDVLPGCVGRPIGDVQVQIRPSAVASELGKGVGRVCVRSSSMMAGYIADGAIKSSMLTDGWFRTGDVGRFDSAGMLHLLGRETDIINVYGMKVIPREVEEIIAAVAGVVEVVVYAGQHPDSQYVKAAIVGDKDLDLAAVRAHCAYHLVYYKRPEKIFQLESLPRTPAGKVIRKQLP